MMFNTIVLIVPCLFNLIICFDDSVPQKFFNNYLDDSNPDSSFPPDSDNGAQPPFKYPLSFSRTGWFSGGWTRQVNVKDLSIAQKVAGVQMRLYKGGIREMHWHVSAEWAYMIYGKVRITSVDDHGRSMVRDVKEGDLWYFPSGFPHSIQGIGDDGGMFLLAFNDGNFNEFDTFLLTDFMDHMPKKVLAKNFDTPESTFKYLPKELYMFAGKLPQPLEVEQAEASEVTGEVPQTFAFYTNQMEPNFTRSGGEVKIIDANNFPITEIAGAIVKLKPGAMRELHWHPNADEWQYYVQGKGRMSVYAGNHQARTMDFYAGDIGYVPQSLPHYIENTGDDDLIIVVVFPTAYYSEISLAQWLAHTPHLLVDQHIRTGEQFILAINKTENVFEPY